ncbi:sialoadhesin-like isoform X4 [Misgurnus anguillicaudatus]|uniref:sialoadhesin-like isoform X4 n=1 Tax=Misgurnus anguillicaudatus TaxID=75329 RepID=UPI003CCF8D66
MHGQRTAQQRVSDICEFLQSEIMNFRLSSLILLLHIQGFLTLDNFNVTCDELNICAVMGTRVTVKCFYSNINIKTGFWFSQKQRTNWRNKDEPEDLTLDSDYSGRVCQRITEDYSKLIISDLIESDSGEYQLMFIMKDGVKHLSSVTVNLTVSVLQVKINPESTGQRVKLSCDSSCPLTSKYHWYKNGQHLTKKQNIFVSFIGHTDSYFCSKSFLGSTLSVCSCWGVTYTSMNVCALVGSTVDIHSSYSHPTGYTVEETYWEFQNRHLALHEDHQFSGRVEFVGNTLRIKNASMSDTGRYQFRINTNTSDEVSCSSGVYLTVTDTRVRSSPDPVIDGEKVILSCSTECTLDSKHTYIWYKNGQQVTDGLTLLNKLYLDSINSEELQDYSCTVREI